MAEYITILDQSTVTSDLECGKCSQRFFNPLILPCLHSFCQKCLIDQIDERKTTDNSIKCPTCDRVAPGGIDSLTQNVWLAFHAHKESMKDPEQVCQYKNCCNTNTYTTCNVSVVYCVQCSINLCESCKIHHDKKHELLSKGDVKSFNEKKYMPVDCVKHIDSKLKHFCLKCEELACSECFWLKHEIHARPTDIEDAASNSLDEIKESVSELDIDHIIKVVDEAIDNGDKLTEQIKNKGENVKIQIKEEFDMLQSQLESHREALLQETENIAGNKETSIKNQTETFRRLKTDVTTANKLAESVVESGCSEEALSIKKVLKDELKRCANNFKQLNFKIEENDKMFAYFDDSLIGRVNSFGSLSTTPATFFAIDTGLGTPMATLGVEKVFSVSRLDRRSIESIPLSACLVWKGRKLDEGTITIIRNDYCAKVSFIPERIGELQLLIRVDTQHIIGSPCKIFVKEMRNYELLRKKHTFYDVSDAYTYGVAVDTNGKVYASCSSRYIQVFDNDGNRLQIIGGKVLIKPYGLAISGETIYVTDHVLNKVFMFLVTADRYIGQFGRKGSKEGEFNQPRGITLDGKGHVLVADSMNKRVQMFTLNGEFAKVIDCNGARVQDVAVNNDGNIHVTYHEVGKVQVFSPDGIPLCCYTNIKHPLGIAIDDMGYRFIGEFNHGGSSSLHIVNSIDRQVNMIKGLGEPYGVALDNNGHVYVVDLCNGIYKY